MKVAIIDYKIGNHQSVLNALKYLVSDVELTCDPQVIRDAVALVLPGVGAFAEGIHHLTNDGLKDCLSQEVLVRKKPILGICLGMQLFADESEEYGLHQGLGWIPGKIVRLKECPSIKIPQIGWNTLLIKKKEPLFLKTDPDTSFYFDHSFYYRCTTEYISATCLYPDEIVAAVQKDNIFGVQFHPEKSQTSGLKLLRCFLNDAVNRAGEIQC